MIKNSLNANSQVKTSSKEQELSIDISGRLEIKLLNKKNNTYHNKFDIFNIDKNGIIINNEEIKASLIFIEISNECFLNGTLEAKGPIADIIIYSKKIRSDCLVFKNFRKAILTTREPIFNSESIDFKKISEDNESIDIEKKGIYFFDNNNENHINLCSRSINIFGNIYSGKINFDAENSIIIGKENDLRVTVHGKDANFLSKTLKNYGVIKGDNEIKIDSNKIENFYEINSENNIECVFNDLEVHKNCRIESYSGKILLNGKEKDSSKFTNYGSVVSGSDIIINSSIFDNSVYDRNSYERENIATIYSKGNLKIATTHGRNLGGVLFSKQYLSIYSQDNEYKKGVFRNLALFEYKDKNSKLDQCGGILFSSQEIDIKIGLVINSGPIYLDNSDSLYPDISGEIYSKNIKINSGSFHNDGGVVNGKIITINASNDIKNISGSIIGVENKLNSGTIVHKTYTHLTKVETSDEKKKLISKPALIASTKDTCIKSKKYIFVFGAAINSDKNLSLNSEKDIILSSSIILKNDSSNSVENNITDRRFSILTSKKTKNNYALYKDSLISMLTAKGDIELKARNLIRINGSKIQSEKNIEIESESNNIEFNPFYLGSALKTKENLSRNVKILGGITTWSENIDSITYHVEVNHLITELFFVKKLMITARNGIINLGEVDFAAVHENEKSSISIVAGEIKSDYSKIIKEETSSSEYEAYGIRTEAHSSFADTISDFATRLDVQGDEKTKIKGVILKSAQLIGDASNAYLGDSLGGSISLVNELSKNERKGNESSDGFSLLYADHILIKSTKKDIDLRGFDIFSENGKIEIHSEGAVHLRESSDQYVWHTDSKGKKFSLEGFVTSNAFTQSAGIGVRGTYDQKNENSSFSGVSFIAFNISAKELSIHSKKETLLCGGKLISGAIGLKIGGNLKIQTVQDSKYEKTQEKSWGGSLGVDANTITKFGINFDVHGSIGDYGVASSLVTQQTGILGKNISGSVKGNIELIGAYIINEDESSNLAINGDIHASTLEDSKNKNGFIIGGGVGFSGDGRPIGNINYSSPEQIEYRASNFPTISGLKINNKIFGSLNSNKNELMKISRFNSIGQIDIKGTFAFKHRKEKNNNEKTKHKSSSTEHIHKLTDHQILTYKINKKIENFEKKETPFKFKDKSYISIDDNIFEVAWDKVNDTWRVVSPLYSFSKPTIPVRYTEGKWVPHSDVGLKGGMNNDKSKLEHDDYLPSKKNNFVERIAKSINKFSLFGKSRSQKNDETTPDEATPERTPLDETMPARTATEGRVTEVKIPARTTTDSGQINIGKNSPKLGDSINFFMPLNAARHKGHVSDKTSIKSVESSLFDLLKQGSEINDFVRNTLLLGAGNQKSDILSSRAMSMLRLNAYRDLTAKLMPRRRSQPNREKMHILRAAAAGNCKEVAEMSYQYALFRFRNELHIRQVTNPDRDHSFLVIEPRGNVDPDFQVVVDPWTIEGGVHLLEDNRFGVGESLKTDKDQARSMLLNQRTESQERLTKVYEEFFEDYLVEFKVEGKIDGLLEEIITKINASTPQGDKPDHALWDIQNSIKDPNIVYKLSGEETVFLPSLPHPSKQEKINTAVDSIMIRI